MAFMVALLDINFEAIGAAPSPEAIATDSLVLSRLWPNGPWLPALPSGSPIPVQHLDDKMWSPPPTRHLTSLEVGLGELPEWLRSSLT